MIDTLIVTPAHSHTLTRTHTPSLLLSLTLTLVFLTVSLRGCGDLKFSLKRLIFGEIRGHCQHHPILLLILILETSYMVFFGVVGMFFFYFTKSAFWFLKNLQKLKLLTKISPLKSVCGHFCTDWVFIDPNVPLFGLCNLSRCPTFGPGPQAGRYELGHTHTSIKKSRLA